MALLKGHRKVKASSLVETLVATVLIVLVFAIASLTLNNVFLNSIKNNTDEVNKELNELHYQYINNKVKVPYSDTLNDWEVSIGKESGSNINFIVFKAEHKNYKKVIVKKIINVSE